MSAPQSLSSAYAGVQAGLALRDRSPLDYWHHSSRQSLEATRLLSDFDELYARAANKAGKTEWAVAATLAMLQKRSTLDDVPLPVWRGKIDAVCLVLDYNQQKLSVQQTVERLLGRWPHHAKWKGDGILSSLKVMPVNGSADEGTWSTLTFMSQENRRSGVGVRADIVLADEPPRESIFRELRKAAHAGRRIIRIIAATPTIRTQWAWLKEEYGDCPRGGVRRHEDWAEVRWGLHDNKALDTLEVEKLLREYRKDPIREARIWGDYVDASGDCPFDLPTLYAMLENEDFVRDPDLRTWEITREVQTETGLARVKAHAAVEIFFRPRPGREYYLNVDPSRGINSARHDPGGILVCEMGTGDVAALYNGYIGGFGLGVLAAGLAVQYNRAIVDPETNGGWGEGVLRGLAEAEYGNIAHTRRILQPGKWEPNLGFTTSATTRPAFIQAVQDWVEAYRLGAPYARVHSRRIVQQLIDTILDEDGKAVAAPGLHDEFLILWGQSLRKTRPMIRDVNMARAQVVQPRRRAIVTFEDLIATVPTQRDGGSGRPPLQRLRRPPRG